MKEIAGQRFYSVEEVATRLEVNALTVRSWIKRGQVHGTRIGKKVYIPSKSLKRYLFGSVENYVHVENATL